MSVYKSPKRKNMTKFIIRRFNLGVPEIEMLKVEAQNEQEAAEKACSGRLTTEPRPQIYLRADVRVVQKMNDHHLFSTKD